ncbi:glutamine--fructose-6-phosphate transaminase (isomerizing) [Mycobacterium sp. AMU20-3851]|uniref:glutamine--fructose-6-phosphate transaminase (isomerizing) n=1 Tax=Mycobacterium sp. AMU20-3851 TaxID=3122055 RepID=UPI00375422E2
MCGIIACRTHAPSVDYLLVGLKRLEYRGYDSAGVAIQTTGGEVMRIRRAGRIHALEEAVRMHAGAELNGAGIGHTRWATHGVATEANAHPHIDCTGRISLVHNGIIENADLLRRELAASGHRFESDVDTEVLCHLIEASMLQSEDLVDAVRSALGSVEGAWGIAVLEQGTGRIVVAANRSPLLVGRTAAGAFAASDIAAIADWVHEFRALEDGEVIELTGDGESGWAGSSAEAPMLVQSSWRNGDADLQGHTDFMAKEIEEQPGVASRLLDAIGDGVANGELWRALGLGELNRLQVIGCGTSLNAGRVIRHTAAVLGGLPVTVTVASEAAATIVEPDTHRIAISQSGETADVLSALTTIPADAPLLTITNNTHSTLARRSDAVLNCSAGPEIGVAATKTFVNQVICGVALTVSALVAGNRLSPAQGRALSAELRRLPDRLTAAIATARAAVPDVAGELVGASGFIYLARGSGLPYAAEGALKMKELSYRWAEHHPAGELKHGPLALVDGGTPVIVVDNGEPKLVGNVSEVRARNGRVVTIGPAGSTIPAIEAHGHPWGPLESVVALQMLARSVALALGRDVDKPRNLAKSVTVE